MTKKSLFSLLLCSISLLPHLINSRVHNFTIHNIRDFRLPISTFGYNKGGELTVDILFQRRDGPLNEGNPPIGFTLDRAFTIGGVKRMEQEEDLMDELQPLNGALPCILDPREGVVVQKLSQLDLKDSIDRISFKVNFPEGDEPDMTVWKTPTMQNGVEVYSRGGMVRSEPLTFNPFNPGFIEDDYTDEEAQKLGFEITQYPLKWTTDATGKGEDHTRLEIRFKVRVTDQAEGGIYELNFHDCYNQNELEDGANNVDERPNFDMYIQVDEQNEDSFLSAGKMFLPEAYFFMFLLFAGATFAWYNTLVTNRAKTFKIHWLMAVVVTVKSASLLAHSIDYFYIDKDGVQHSWAYIFYVIHFMKGVLLFFTLALIATGWSFVKCVLSDNERRIFIIVLPLQIIANIAFIILESSEEAQANYENWQEIFIFVDLICCGAIMFPIIWSIRHLTMASSIDGKGAVNLRKLELFKKFYAWTIAYIYATRIGGLLLEMALNYKLEWAAEMLTELATFAYFVYTGYLFRPGSDKNPYIRLRGDDEDEEAQNLMQSGAMENMKRRNTSNMSRKIDSGSDDDSDEEDVVDTIALIKAAKTPAVNV